jgi:large exoprotein involved in heme utilization and adhesion
MLTSGSQIFNINKGSETGGNLTVNASESVELTGRRTELRTRADGDGDTGDLTINSRKLIVRDGAEVLTSTRNNGAGGQLTVNASEAVELIGTNDVFSGLVSATFAAGDAGKLTINTGRLLIQDGATVSTESSTSRVSGREILATGRGGDLTVNASDSVELLGNDRNGNPSALFSITQGTADAGNLKIATNNLIVRNGAEINVSSEGTGNAGNLELIARSIRLDNGGKLTATSVSGEGGNITLSDLNLLLLRGNSEISTDATAGSGNGGNINIDTDVLAAVERSNITAKAVEGRGGNIRIATQGLFLSPDSEINASSERGIDGVVEINRPDIDPSAELVVLPAEIIDVSGLVAQGCPAGGGSIARGGSQFVVTGRGGLPPTPAEATRSDTTLADLGTPVQNAENLAIADTSSNQTSSSPTTLVEATGWVIGSKGEVLLTANAPTATTQIPWLTPTSCHS